MNDQQRIETAAENCEVLRARLARYEDADGQPVAQQLDWQEMLHGCTYFNTYGQPIELKTSQEVKIFIDGNWGEGFDRWLIPAGAPFIACYSSQFQRAYFAKPKPKPKPSGVVLPERTEMNRMWQEVQDGAMRNPMPPHIVFAEQLARLNQPASAGDDQARASLSANHSEQVRHMVPQMVDFSPVPDDFRSQANGYRAGWNDCRAAIAAAPSAGSQKEQDE